MDESPFANFSHTHALYLEPYLNQYFKTYQHIITLDSIPMGPISPMVKRITSPNLSPFYSVGNYSSNNGMNDSCIFALLRYPCSNPKYSNIKRTDAFMGADDIPSIFGFLIANGYTINTDLVKMMNGSQIALGGTFSETRNSGARKLICMFSYL